MKRTEIDLNFDAGEMPEMIRDGSQDRIMEFVSSVNVACGGHAGDEETMRLTLASAKKRGLAVGAHPSYPDRANFGRMTLNLAPSELETALVSQLSALAQMATRSGVALTHVKPHGALYNVAADDETTARTVARAVSKISRQLILVGLAGSHGLDVYRDEGFATAGEAFADRNYEDDGRLRPRRFEDALITDSKAAGARALKLAREGMIKTLRGKDIFLDSRTLCIHGDTPGALDIARAVHDTLASAGVVIKPLKG